MSISYPESAGASEQPRPSYYANIPAPVRYHPELPPAAKLLYGEITALCSVEGFCWAQNPYFMDLYGVDRSTVKRWLSALASAGFVRIEHDRSTNARRIFLAVPPPSEKVISDIQNSQDLINPQKSEGVAQNCATPGAKTRHPRRKNAPQSTTESNTKSSTLRNVAIAPPSALAPGEKVSASPMGRTPEEDVERVVTITSDQASRKRFKQLWYIAKKANRLEEWDTAYNATRTALESPERRPDRPGAYFHAVLIHRLNELGISVPVGTRQERSEIRRMIAQSLATASSSEA